MSDIYSKKTVRPYSELIADLLPVADNLIRSLRHKQIPGAETISTAEALLTEVILRIDLDHMTEDQIGTAVFHNSFGGELTDDYVTDLLTQLPDIWNTMVEIARRKLISSDDTMAAGETVQLLIKEGFLAPVEIRTCFGEGKFYTPTSGGYRLLSICGSLQTTETSQPLSSLPDGLLYSPENWNVVSFCKAFLLQRYFKKQNIGRYLIYSDSKKTSILLGCGVSASPEVRYCYVWIPGSANAVGDYEYLRELVGSSTIDEVVIVYPLEKNKGEIMEYMDSTLYNEKIKLFCLEVENK